MPKDYSNDFNLGHRFPANQTPYQQCTVCGLVRFVWDRPAMTCPEKPLDEVVLGWGEKYGRMP